MSGTNFNRARILNREPNLAELAALKTRIAAGECHDEIVHLAYERSQLATVVYETGCS